jgi:SAM-dependent methyltransferase
MTSSTRDFLRPHLMTLPPHRVMIRAIEARLFAETAPELVEPVLDVGSGDGTFAEIAFPGKVIYGIDPIVSDTHEAHQRRVYRGLSVADGKHLPFADHTFASAFSNCVLEHVAPLTETLSETFRTLKPGAPFIASVVGNRFPAQLLGTKILNALGLDGMRYGRWFNKISVHRNTLSREEWSKRFTDAGFEVVSCRPYFSDAALALFDASHYIAAPSLLTRKLLGRWLIAPPLTLNWLWEPILRPLYEAPAPADAPYYFFILRKPAAQ